MPTCDWCKSTDNVHFEVKTSYSGTLYRYMVCHFCAHNPHLLASDSGYDSILITNTWNDKYLVLDANNEVVEEPTHTCTECHNNRHSDGPYFVVKHNHSDRVLCWWCCTTLQAESLTDFRMVTN